ncbi:hypothetical protein GOD90_20320 [Sinorhizobium medicae]|nr:hypothetical protein [Sinorhizobium medicae]MDX0899301.1 hypothetical protein [Sinorhizobium medicae]MDX1120218.1 hypothetical protein [Sinorhizobium medicae]MDX1242700.1 hypothetical protein [Sinorhizobium medicae]
MPDPAGQTAFGQIAETVPAADAARELMFKWTDVILDQSNDLWTVTLPFLTATILVSLHLASRDPPASATPLEPVPRWLWILLLASFLGCVASLFFAYKLKGTVIDALGAGMKDGKFALATNPAWDALFQFLTFALAFMTFVGAVGLYPRLVIRSLINVLTGRG